MADKKKTTLKNTQTKTPSVNEAWKFDSHVDGA